MTVRIGEKLDHKLRSVNLSYLDGRVFGIFGSSPGQIALMLLALRVSEVTALVVVECQAQLALVRSCGNERKGSFQGLQFSSN